MEQYDKGIIKVNKHHRKKTVVKPDIYQRIIWSITFPSMLIALIFVASQSTYPVHATGGGNETGATAAPGGASNATAGNTITANDTTTTFAPQGAGIGANDTSASNATAGNTITANDTTTTFAPQGAGIGANDTSASNATAGNTI